MGPGGTHHSKQRERGQVSPLWRGLCRKQDSPPTWDCSLLLSSQQSNLWKGCTGRLWIFIFFFFNPRIDVTLASSHIQPSMWGSICEGYHFGLPWSWLPLTWELSLSKAGSPGQQEIPWLLQLAFSKLGWGGGWGAFVHVEMWVIPSEDGIPVEKHLGKAPFYFPLLEICNQTGILKAKESCSTFLSVEFLKSVCCPTPIFSPKEHTDI